MIPQHLLQKLKEACFCFLFIIKHFLATGSQLLRWEMRDAKPHPTLLLYYVYRDWEGKTCMDLPPLSFGHLPLTKGEKERGLEGKIRQRGQKKSPSLNKCPGRGK
jgi:hypothetical protein